MGNARDNIDGHSNGLDEEAFGDALAGDDPWGGMLSDGEAKTLEDSPYKTSVRPSISHLMIWTTCSAAYLAIVRWLSPPEAQQGFQGVYMVYAVLTGATFMGAVVLVGERIRRGRPMMRQPGHWLLLVPSVVLLLYIPLMATLNRLVQSDSGPIAFYPQHYLAYAAVFAFAPVAYTVAACTARSRSWRVIHIAMVVATAAQCGQFLLIGMNVLGGTLAVIMSMVMQWAKPVIAIGILMLGIAEFARGPKRDWLHWTGITTMVAASLLQAATMLLM